jgi:predicted acyltransferase
MSAPAADRLISLDVFRGLTIAAMVLVNNPGTWSAVYPQLAHAEWHGWTLTDTIFPFFLVIVGIAIPIALGKRVAAGQVGPDLYGKIARRTVLLFALGIWLATFPFYDWMKGEWLNWGEVRIMGVLQRIALCYLVCSLAFLWLGPRGMVALSAAVLLGYWFLLMVPGGGDLTPQGNLGAVLDRAVLGAHIWKGGGGAYDPEGLLSTLPAIGTTMIGVLAGMIVQKKVTDTQKAAELFFWGFVLLSAGWLWGQVFPINKPIWTSSYAIFMGGMGLMVLAACLWMIDIRGSTWWTRPFVVFGVNALALFVGSGMLARLLNKIPGGVTAEGALVSLKDTIYRGVFAPLADPVNASLAFAVAFLAVWLALMWPLWAKKIYIKI